MTTAALGKMYKDGELIVEEGHTGDCLYVIQEGEVEVFRQRADAEISLAVLHENEFFGEVPLFERRKRSASVRAKGDVRVLTVDRKTLMSRIHEDPTLAYRILETLSRRIRALDEEVSDLMVALGKGARKAEG